MEQMKFSLKGKKAFWAAGWLVCCGAVAGAMLWAATPTVGCTEKDLTRIPVAGVVADANSGSEVPEEKRVFLTFDDGPSATTEKVLDVLKEKGVPATFFVIAAPNNEKYMTTIRRAVEEGHQIALHSCSHEYKKIYESPAAYWADIKQLREKISPYVDVDSIHWLRFPGGSTNTVSHKYGGSGIMKSLKAQAQEKGYNYVDWNVCAEDAVGGRPSAQTVYENVIREAGDKTTCVVLMHDTKATKTTAEALPQIIDWFTEQGYRFCKIDELDKQI